MKYALSAKKWFMKTSTRTVKYESRVTKLNLMYMFLQCNFLLYFRDIQAWHKSELLAYFTFSMFSICTNYFIAYATFRSIVFEREPGPGFSFTSPDKIKLSAGFGILGVQLHVHTSAHA